MPDLDLIKQEEQGGAGPPALCDGEGIASGIRFAEPITPRQIGRYDMPDSQHWVGTWTTAPAPAETGAFTNQTLRMTMRASLGGETVRVRISNAYGRRPLDVGGAHLALHDAGPAIVPGSDRKLSFGGEKVATIAAGAVLFSDPVGLGAAPPAALAVSLYLPGEVLNDFQITGRYARQTNYISPPGDFTAANVMPISSPTSDWFFVCGVDG